MRPEGCDDWVVMGRLVDLDSLPRGNPPRTSTTLPTPFPTDTYFFSSFSDGVEFASSPETSTLALVRAGGVACVAFTPTTEFLP